MTRNTSDRTWIAQAVRLLRADAHRSADTHLIKVPLPESHSATMYLKDESTHPTGSLKHRLARSLFLYALCNGAVGPTTTIVEATSGSTAVSEAYFARMLGLPFVAVMPASTSTEKQRLIERAGGRCHLVDNPGEVYAAAEEIAASTGGVYLDQFTYAERATDWRGNNNIAESLFAQLEREEHPIPTWVVVGAGTGGTSATIGRYLRYQANETTQLCVVDPEGSAFLKHWSGKSVADACGSRIEGIGRPRVEPSFLSDVVDHMIGVPDAGSVAAMQLLNECAAIAAGPSTGTNLYGALQLACAMAETGQTGSIISLVADRSERYGSTYGDDDWLASRDLLPGAYAEQVRRAWHDATWSPAVAN